ncbi:MerC domain-containing protein [Henriciella algicola]|uniref:MerC domain-containing protein n=1 Tax=Henriciella algicola TaxID=1608422 RepID=A0A399R6Y1_9PROT|nr:MerC domain-containing protein [Henriciella algicola]RIJ27386.1 MerC domain-containing protein [Henriciella algicola]
MSSTLANRVLDASAITLSGLCLVHCLALPALAVALPLAGLWAEQEWVHQIFALSALPITVFAMTRPFHEGARTSFILLAGIGLALLIGAAFIEGLHDLETPLTVVGALLLATAHIRRWRRQHEAALTTGAAK